MFVQRELGAKAKALAEQFPVVSITGPRQSGKSTLVKEVFPDYRYVSLEDEDMRTLANKDPRSFLSLYDNHVIFDEAQRSPSLFSYLQGVVDATDRPGQFILSGSQNFLLMESITQSLAGRVAVLNLLPFSGDELSRAKLLPARLNEALLNGGYPRVYSARINPADYYPSYIQTYLERDVRQGSGILKLSDFERFLGLCAERNAELLNKEQLARDCGIAVKTVESWLSVLEASFLTLRLQPYYKNYGKRLIKSPKLCFCDTGLACNLLGLEDASELVTTPYRGAIFESAVVSEVLKAHLNQGKKPKLYYWRDTAKIEADLIIEKGTSIAWLIEVKSSATYSPKFFKNLSYLGDLIGLPTEQRCVVYAGDQSFETTQGRVVSFGDIHELVS